MNIKDDDQEQQQDEERDPLLQEMIDYLKQNKTSFVQALLKPPHKRLDDGKEGMFRV